ARCRKRRQRHTLTPVARLLATRREETYGTSLTSASAFARFAALSASAAADWAWALAALRARASAISALLRRGRLMTTGRGLIPNCSRSPLVRPTAPLAGGGEPIAQLVRLLLDRGAPQGPRLELRLGEVLLALQSGGLGEQRPESRVVVGELRDVGEVQRGVVEERLPLGELRLEGTAGSHDGCPFRPVGRLRLPGGAWIAGSHGFLRVIAGWGGP